MHKIQGQGRSRLKAKAGQGPRPQAETSAKMDPARIQKALDSLIYLPLLKGRSAAEPPEAGPDAPQPLPGMQARQCRPWDRGDLLRRLQSFQPATWFCKPACAGPVACARRGWANTGLDQLTCEVLPITVCCVGVSTPCTVALSVDLRLMMRAGRIGGGVVQTCGAKLSFPLPPRMPLHEVEKVGILGFLPVTVG